MFTLSHDEIIKLISEHVNQAVFTWRNMSDLTPRMYNMMIASEILFLAGQGSVGNLDAVVEVFNEFDGVDGWMANNAFVITLKAKD